MHPCFEVNPVENNLLSSPPAKVGIVFYKGYTKRKPFEVEKGLKVEKGSTEQRPAA